MQLLALALVEHPLALGYKKHCLAVAAIWPKDLASQLAQLVAVVVVPPHGMVVAQVVAVVVVLPPTNLALLLVVVAQVVVEGVCLVPTAQLAQQQSSPWPGPWQQKGLAQHLAQHCLRPTSEAMAQQLDQLEVGPQLVLAQGPAPGGQGAAAAFGPTPPPSASRSQLAQTSAKELAPSPPQIMSQPRRLRHDRPPHLAQNEEEEELGGRPHASLARCAKELAHVLELALDLAHVL